MGREIAAHRVLFRSFASKSSGRPASRPGQIPAHFPRHPPACTRHPREGGGEDSHFKCNTWSKKISAGVL